MEDWSIKVNHISKKFRIYHEKRTTVYETITSWFNRKKHFETLQVLDDVNFDVKKGEMFGIIGRNGSGKTTLLKIISKIIHPDDGYVQTEGSIVPLIALGLGFHPELTATANVIQSSVLFGFSKKQIMKKMDDVINFAGLEKFADTKIKNFSSGMQMRLAFATAIQVNPEVLVLDEVFSVGDADFQKKCYDSMMDFKNNGKSIIFVSHDLDAVRKHCDRSLFLNHGQVKDIGNTDNVVNSYLDYLKDHKDEIKSI